MSEKKTKSRGVWTTGMAIAFLAFLLVLFLISDVILTALNPVGSLPFFRKNDLRRLLPYTAQRILTGFFMAVLMCMLLLWRG